MKNKITIQKNIIKVKTKDVVKHYNNIAQDGIITPTEISELQGSLQELNNDKVDKQERTSGIDLRTRLFNCEIASIVVLDTLVSFRFLPLSISPFTLQKKRLAVSLKGKGRDEIVQIVQGKRENDLEKGGLGSRIKGMFGGGKE